MNDEQVDSVSEALPETPVSKSPEPSSSSRLGGTPASPGEPATETPAQPATEAPAENLPASVPDATGDETAAPEQPDGPNATAPAKAFGRVREVVNQETGERGLKLGASIPAASERHNLPIVPVVTQTPARASTLPHPVPVQPEDEDDDGELAEPAKALPRDAEAPLYSPVPFEVRREFGGRPIFLRPLDVTWVPTRAADLFVGQNNTGGPLYKIGVRRLIVAGHRYDAAARAAGVSCRQFCHDANAKIVAEADAAYEAHVAAQKASE